MHKHGVHNDFLSVFRQRPHAVATVGGNDAAIRGTVRFYQTRTGVWVVSSFAGLPAAPGPCGGAVLGFHIHGGTACSPRGDDPFGGAMTHYNPGDCPHPFHAGDMPPLFVNRNGTAFSAFLTDRFTVREILGKTVIVHSAPDDFTTQPAGMSGQKIACGIIRPTR